MQIDSYSSVYRYQTGYLPPEATSAGRAVAGSPPADSMIPDPVPAVGKVEGIMPADGRSDSPANGTDQASAEPMDSEHVGVATESPQDPEQHAEARRELAEIQQIRQLQLRDREVKAHEAAHAAVGGHLTGAPSFSYERGPDGVNYAVAGEVSVASPVAAGDPEQTLRQAEQVQRAALAPADPSPQDRKVAAAAARTASEARIELMQLKSARTDQTGKPGEEPARVTDTDAPARDEATSVTKQNPVTESYRAVAVEPGAQPTSILVDLTV